MIPPAPPENAARGTSAKLVVSAVMRIGRNLTRPAVISPSMTPNPLARKLLNEGDENDGVGHDNPDKQEGAHHGRQTKGAARNGQG